MLLSRAIALNNHAARCSNRESVVALRLALKTLRDKCQLETCEGEVRELDMGVITSDCSAVTTPVSSAIGLTNSVGSHKPMAFFTGMDEKGSLTPTRRDLESSAAIIRTRHSRSLMNRLGHGRRADGHLEVFDGLLMVSLEHEVSEDLAAAVILLNLAVFRQTMGILLNRSSMLMQAKNVYHMVMTVLESFRDEGGDIPSLLLLVLFNNLAEIEAQFHGYTAMRYYLDCGRAVLSESDHGLQDADLALFFRNMMLPIPAVAAAA
jgi:hypothetical protein